MLLCIICSPLAAQQYPVKVQVQTLQPVPAQISNLYNGSQARMIITLLNTDLQEATMNVRLRLNIKGTTVALRNRDYGSYPLVRLDAGIPVQLSLNDLAPYFNLDNMEISGIPPSQLQQTGKLPDGFYTFCVDVLDANSGRLVSNDKLSCSPPAWISTSEPPLLNLPRKGEAVAFREPLNIVFNWTPRHMGSPNAAFLTEYEFTLVELWDTTILPEAAFGTMPPLYQTYTSATTLLYGPAEPPLLPGKRYGWRIRAIAKQGVDEFDIFTNHGYSEIYYFNLQDDCQPPQQVAATVANGEATVTWLPQPKMFEYLVEYREQDNDKATWFNVKSSDPQAVIRDAVPGHKYEYRVGGSCSLGSKTLGELHSFEMPAKDAVDSGSCGLLSDIKLANDTALKTLQPDDQIMAGDFPVRFMTLKNNGGSYSGTGYITIPFLGYNRVKVKFDNIQVNTNRQLMKGMLVTTFDSTKLQGTSVDSVVQAIGSLASVINDLIHLTLDADYVKVKEMAEAIKKAAEEELPEELKTRMNQAADNLVNAKDEYDAAKKELADAKTPEEKAAAEQKVKDAEKKFDDAKEEVKAVNKEKEKLVNDVAGIIVKAIKELKEDAKGWDKSADLSTQQAAMRQAVYDKQGLEETTDASIGFAIGDIQQVTLSDAEISDEMKQFDEVVEQFHLTSANVKAYRLVSAIQKFYDTPAAIAQFLSQDKALKGTSMLKALMTDKMQGKTDKELIKVVKQSILDQLIIILNSDQLTK
ncbi:fibronectin type III domain-containing protein [Chitinophaga sp. CF418]|uniref:fibronectin type III domain-containing protein n=1 Tax=Chitinophaga sp. CF418 TaxID=1855287 RepID=UPI00122C18F9|nr:fibronectin type III domain-containing protein [Chitinophaga sp. CF418]